MATVSTDFLEEYHLNFWFFYHNFHNLPLVDKYSHHPCYWSILSKLPPLSKLPRLTVCDKDGCFSGFASKILHCSSYDVTWTPFVRLTLLLVVHSFSVANSSILPFCLAAVSTSELPLLLLFVVLQYRQWSGRQFRVISEAPHLQYNVMVINERYLPWFLFLCHSRIFSVL